MHISCLMSKTSSSLIMSRSYHLSRSLDIFVFLVKPSHRDAKKQCSHIMQAAVMHGLKETTNGKNVSILKTHCILMVFVVDDLIIVGIASQRPHPCTSVFNLKKIHAIAPISSCLFFISCICLRWQDFHVAY